MKITSFIPYIAIHLLLFSQVHSISFPIFNGYQIRDLTSTTAQLFDIQASLWTATGLVNNNRLTTTCGGYPLLGGVNILRSNGYFQRQYTSLPDHNIVYFQVRFFIIDRIESSYYFVIQIDSQNITSQNIEYAQDVAPGDVCGLSYHDLMWYTIVGQVPHSGNSLSLEVISELTRNPNQASFGIRSISLIFTTVTPLTLTQPEYCYRGFDNYIYGATGECACIRGEYPDPTNSNQCTSCHENCLDCFGPTAGECYICKPGYSFTGTECIKCDDSCNTCSGPGVNECTTCADGLWLYLDNVCLSNCNFPAGNQLVVDDFQMCNVLSGWTPSPCQTTEYLLYDGQTCVSSCNTPLVVQVIDGINQCLQPCLPNEYYDTTTNSCKTECKAPEVVIEVESVMTCSGGLPEQEKEQVQTIAGVTNNAGTVSSLGLAAMSVASSSNPNSLAFASLVKMLQYIRYMKVNYPPKLEYMLSQTDSGSLSFNFGPSLPINIQNNFPDYPLPGKFDRYGLMSSFIVNFWDGLTSILIVMGALIVTLTIIVLTKKSKKLKYAHIFFTKIKMILKWDFVILMIGSNYDGIAFFSSLELRTVRIDSMLSSLSLFVCLIANLVAIGLFVLIIRIIRDVQKSKYQIADISSIHKKQHTVISNMEHKWKNCEIVFINFKDGSFFQQAFMFFFLLRIYFFNLIIGYLFEYPLVQAILITVLSLAMMGYLLWKRSLRKTFDLVQLLINETVLLLVNISVLILAILDALESESINIRIHLGDLVIICNVIFSVLVLLFLFIELCIGIFKLIKALRASKEQGINALLQVFLVFFKQDAVAIEEKETETGRKSIRLNLESPTSLKIMNSPENISPIRLLFLKSKLFSSSSLNVDADIPLKKNTLEDKDSPDVSGNQSPSGEPSSPIKFANFSSSRLLALPSKMGSFGNNKLMEELEDNTERERSFGVPSLGTLKDIEATRSSSPTNLQRSAVLPTRLKILNRSRSRVAPASNAVVEHEDYIEKNEGVKERDGYTGTRRQRTLKENGKIAGGKQDSPVRSAVSFKESLVFEEKNLMEKPYKGIIRVHYMKRTESKRGQELEDSTLVEGDKVFEVCE